MRQKYPNLSYKEICDTVVDLWDISWQELNEADPNLAQIDKLLSQRKALLKDLLATATEYEINDTTAHVMKHVIDLENLFKDLADDGKTPDLQTEYMYQTLKQDLKMLGRASKR